MYRSLGVLNTPLLHPHTHPAAPVRFPAQRVGQCVVAAGARMHAVAQQTIFFICMRVIDSMILFSPETARMSRVGDIVCFFWPTSLTRTRTHSLPFPKAPQVAQHTVCSCPSPCRPTPPTSPTPTSWRACGVHAAMHSA
jgi:hypothetical protein